MAAARRLLSALMAAGVLVGATACLNTSGPATPVTTPSASSAEPTSTAVTTAATSSAPAAASYPSTAQAYAEALLQAWRLRQFSRVGDLAVPEVLSQLQTAPDIETDWTFVKCEGAAGSSYCQYLNGDGDSATLRLSNQQLGKAHATTEVILDRTAYSNNAVEYVKAFVEAWRNGNPKRMETLANPTEVSYFTHYTPPETYSTCATLTAGTASVRVYSAAGLNYTITVAVATLGSKHAITGHASTPAACP